MIKMAVFASGTGTNAENLCMFFSGSAFANITLILSNNPNAGVGLVAKRMNIPYRVFTRSELEETGAVLQLLKEQDINLILLAGFLWKIPGTLIQAYPKRIVNIHPALLPRFGGKGYYGLRVHHAVLEAGLPISGISIHFVNEVLDEGEIIFQAACHVSKSETTESLALKIHALEMRYFPVIVEKLLNTVS